ncbi:MULTISPECIES: CIS tube protein [unclassified Nostoc]|uniref:CIS tube protein n=1 Tax=unclassified Nostoc TaxID=2593658 RepID=UPI000B9558D0|nr:hypothetical protein [Nostoc sp. 'Peltigera membranacea cyanobiont' 232]OYE04553.1 hypothetical protein CDG79_12290 [Nostoc sp. 'Peltigera membranacea cyanobiont' 232]
MASPAIIVIQKRQPQLEKAKLVAYKSGATKDIELMFNPTEISFTRSVTWESEKGNRTTKLFPKVNFSALDPYKFTLKQLLFDTYETKESVMKYINIIKQGVEGIDDKPDTRPPVYRFIWGTEYFYCVITSLTYTLSMFLTDGTPVRAMVDIALQQVDEANLPASKESASKGKARQPNQKLGKTDKQK